MLVHLSIHLCCFRERYERRFSSRCLAIFHARDTLPVSHFTSPWATQVHYVPRCRETQSGLTHHCSSITLHLRFRLESRRTFPAATKCHRCWTIATVPRNPQEQVCLRSNLQWTLLLTWDWWQAINLDLQRSFKSLARLRQDPSLVIIIALGFLDKNINPILSRFFWILSLYPFGFQVNQFL